MTPSCIIFLYSVDKMDKATSRFRIGLMFSVMGLALLGSICAVVAGKRERAARVNAWTKEREQGK